MFTGEDQVFPFGTGVLGRPCKKVTQASRDHQKMAFFICADYQNITETSKCKDSGEQLRATKALKVFPTFN